MGVIKNNSEMWAAYMQVALPAGRFINQVLGYLINLTILFGK